MRELEGIGGGGEEEEKIYDDEEISELIFLIQCGYSNYKDRGTPDIPRCILQTEMSPGGAYLRLRGHFSYYFFLAKRKEMKQQCHCHFIYLKFTTHMIWRITIRKRHGVNRSTAGNWAS